MKIPEKFHKSGKHPKAKTVGSLIKILQELPKGLLIQQGFSDGVEVVVYNIKTYPILEFNEVD